MTSNSENIRQLINLMESITDEPTLVEGWVDGLKNRLSGIMGSRQQAQMAQQLSQEYYAWLGKTKRAGNVDDVMRFMTMQVGFNEDDIEHVLREVGFDYGDDAEEPTAEEPDAEDEIEDPKSDDHGLSVEKSDDTIESKEVRDDPRRYRDASGEWNRKKIRAKLDKLPIGSKLTLGTSTFSRTVGDDATKFMDARGEFQEGIMEAKDPDVLTRKVIKNIMSSIAARVNDAYLLDGPANDAAAATASAPGRGGRGQGNSDTQGSENVPGKKGSGQYDAKEMFNILRVDFQKSESWVNTLNRKVMNARAISELSDNDMNDLALLGWALVRARN